MTFRRLRAMLFTDLGILILLALSRIILHALTNHQYGFHRDELAFLNDSRYLAWGYVADIFVCHGLKESWADFWEHIHHFG